MAQYRHARVKSGHSYTKQKILMMLLAMALVCCVSISGTLAWIMRQTDPVVNTFTYGDINIALTEQAGVPDSQIAQQRQFTMIPGLTIEKDPTVTVTKGSESCWLFAHLEQSDNFDRFLSYTAADGWKRLPLSDTQTTTGTAVYYRMVLQEDTAQADQAYPVLLDNQVTVKNVTKAELEAMEYYPTLTVTAYAIQCEGIMDSSITDSEEQAEIAWSMIAAP